MRTVVQKSHLSAGRRRLVELMQSIHYGRIEDLLVQGGEPIFTPAPRMVREIRFGDHGPADRRVTSADFKLKTQVVDLLERLTQLGNGRVERIVVKHGLPFSLAIEEQPV